MKSYIKAMLLGLVLMLFGEDDKKEKEDEKPTVKPPGEGDDDKRFIVVSGIGNEYDIRKIPDVTTIGLARINSPAYEKQPDGNKMYQARKDIYEELFRSEKYERIRKDAIGNNPILGYSVIGLLNSLANHTKDDIYMDGREPSALLQKIAGNMALGDMLDDSTGIEWFVKAMRESFPFIFMLDNDSRKRINLSMLDLLKSIQSNLPSAKDIEFNLLDAGFFPQFRTSNSTVLDLNHGDIMLISRYMPAGNMIADVDMYDKKVKKSIRMFVEDFRGYPLESAYCLFLYSVDKDIHHQWSSIIDYTGKRTFSARNGNDRTIPGTSDAFFSGETNMVDKTYKLFDLYVDSIFFYFAVSFPMEFDAALKQDTSNDFATMIVGLMSLGILDFRISMNDTNKERIALT